MAHNTQEYRHYVRQRLYEDLYPFYIIDTNDWTEGRLVTNKTFENVVELLTLVVVRSHCDVLTEADFSPDSDGSVWLQWYHEPYIIIAIVDDDEIHYYLEDRYETEEDIVNWIKWRDFGERLAKILTKCICAHESQRNISIAHGKYTFSQYKNS